LPRRRTILIDDSAVYRGKDVPMASAVAGPQAFLIGGARTAVGRYGDGGAISLGHPLGSSGSRLAITLLGRMEREDAAIGLATMCIGVGQGTAVLLERV
jgi:hypothetical protein